MHDDGVGYKSPPRHTQFKKGQSGNPKGRPRKKIVPATCDVFEREVKMNIGGNDVSLPLKDAMTTTLLFDGLKGNTSSLKAYMDIATSTPLSDEETERTTPRYTTVFVNPRACDEMLLVLGVTKPQGQATVVEMWVLEEALNRKPSRKFDESSIPRILTGIADPEMAGDILEQAGYHMERDLLTGKIKRILLHATEFGDHNDIRR